MWLFPAGSEGVGAILMRAPQLMLCKPATNDRWDRRTVELAAFAFKNGHCNVPEARFSCSSSRVYDKSFLVSPCPVAFSGVWQIVRNTSRGSMLVSEVYEVLVLCESSLNDVLAGCVYTFQSGLLGAEAAIPMAAG